MLPPGYTTSVVLDSKSQHYLASTLSDLELYFGAKTITMWALVYRHGTCL